MGKILTTTLMITVYFWLFGSTARAEELIERNYAIKGVSQLLATGSGDLRITFGESESLLVTAPKSIIEKIKVVGKGDVLQIKQAGGWNTKADYPITYELTIKQLSSITLAGALKVLMNSPVHSETFDLNLAGSVDLTIPSMILSQQLQGNIRGAAKLTIVELLSEKLELRSMGASTIKISGSVQMQQIDLSGAVEYVAGHLLSQEAHLQLTGASNAKVAVHRLLKTNMKGASNVAYYGDPKVEQKSLGASTVKRLGHSADDQQ